MIGTLQLKKGTQHKINFETLERSIKKDAFTVCVSGTLQYTKKGVLERVMHRSGTSTTAGGDRRTTNAY